MKIKRFIVMVGEQYYPGGGFEDFHSSWDTFEEAQNAEADATEGERKDWCWSHIVDLDNFDKSKL